MEPDAGPIGVRAVDSLVSYPARPPALAPEPAPDLNRPPDLSPPPELDHVPDLIAEVTVTADDPDDQPIGFVDFYETTRDRVGRALAMTLGDVHLAAEAVDEAMARAFQRWDRVGRLDSPGGWVYRVGLNWATSVLRRRHRAPNPPAERGPTDVGPLSEPDVAAALAELPSRQRAVIVCRFYLGLSEAETAATLAIRPGTAKSRLSRALRHLETRLAHLAPEEQQ
ncbi:MAG: putative polymerase subfamily sigma factor [Actinomycetia bacterium]|nr:putative polymerase subfamily sigma factor [Actinomycetes bacterium]